MSWTPWKHKAKRCEISRTGGQISSRPFLALRAEERQRDVLKRRDDLISTEEADSVIQRVSLSLMSGHQEMSDRYQRLDAELAEAWVTVVAL